MLVLVLALAVLFAVAQASFFEWAFHRYWLHRPWLPKNCFTTHTLVHHQLCKHDDTFEVHDEEQHEALTFAWWGGPTLVSMNIVPWAIGAWALSAAHVVAPIAAVAVLVTMSVTFGLYYVGYEGFHYLMHKPTIGIIERSRLFLFLKRHHRIHHVRMDRNLNVLVPFADLCLGTLVLDMAIPATTSPHARELARRHSRRLQRSEREAHEHPALDSATLDHLKVTAEREARAGGD